MTDNLINSKILICENSERDYRDIIDCLPNHLIPDAYRQNCNIENYKGLDKCFYRLGICDLLEVETLDLFRNREKYVKKNYGDEDETVYTNERRRTHAREVSPSKRRLPRNICKNGRTIADCTHAEKSARWEAKQVKNRGYVDDGLGVLA